MIKKKYLSEYNKIDRNIDKVRENKLDDHYLVVISLLDQLVPDVLDLGAPEGGPVVELALENPGLAPQQLQQLTHRHSVEYKYCQRQVEVGQGR